MALGFILSVLGHKINNKYVVLAKVRHSQRMNDPLVQMWIITNKDGTILSAHCAGCMADVENCCSHIASVLFYIECWTRVNGKLSCTKVKCTWLLPTHLKQVDYARVRDIDFTSTKKLKANVDKSIENLDTKDLPQFTTGTYHVSAPVSRNDKVRVAIPKAEEFKQFYDSLSVCKNKPICLSLVQPHPESFIFKTRRIKPTTNLFDENYLHMNYANLLQECHKIQLRISDAEIQLIERETLNQARESSFYWHRAGRIGASRGKAASHTDPSQPSQSLIKAICYPNEFKFSTAATRHGL